jgi:hypothetical protein
MWCFFTYKLRFHPCFGRYTLGRYQECLGCWESLCGSFLRCSRSVSLDFTPSSHAHARRGVNTYTHTVTRKAAVCTIQSVYPRPTYNAVLALWELTRRVNVPTRSGIFKFSPGRGPPVRHTWFGHARTLLRRARRWRSGKWRAGRPLRTGE